VRTLRNRLPVLGGLTVLAAAGSLMTPKSATTSRLIEVHVPMTAVPGGLGDLNVTAVRDGSNGIATVNVGLWGRLVRTQLTPRRE
jgi:hypothetical protein